MSFIDRAVRSSGSGAAAGDSTRFFRGALALRPPWRFSIAPNLANNRFRPLLVAGVITFLHAPLLTKPLFDSDEAIYASIAALVNAGGRLYAEGGVDNKFPGIYYTYAAVFRVFGPYAMGAVHVLTILVVVATAFVLSRITRRVGGRSAPCTAGLLYGVLTTFYYPKMLAANTEVFMTLPLSASVLLSLPDAEGRPRGAGTLVLAGVLVGMATMYRQLAALNLILTCGAAFLVSNERWMKRALRVAAPIVGFVVSFSAVAAVFSLRGNLRAFWFWAFAAAATRYLPLGWTYSWPALDLLGMLGVMAVPTALTVWRARRWAAVPLLERLLWGWLAIGVISILALWRFHPHYVIHAIAPVSVLSALELEARLGEGTVASRRRLTWITTTLLAVPSLVFVVLALLLEPIAGGFSPGRPDYPRVARYAREATRTGQRIFVWGAYAPLYVLSERLSASRFVGFMRGCPRGANVPMSICWDSGPETWPLLAEDLRTTPAELLIDTATADYAGFGVYPLQSIPVLRHLVSSRYSLETTIDGVRVYRYRHE